MAYPINKDTDWLSKEKRQMFVDKVGALIIKGKEEDLEKIFELAEKIVNKAFEIFPDKQESQEKPL